MSYSSSVTCTRQMHFCAGHRVLGHEGKCATPHGHNYDVWITAEAQSLDELGRIIDFSVLKDRVGGWIDTHWDHTFLVYEKDQQVIDGLSLMGGSKVPFLCTFNPTAENIARYLLDHVCPQTLAGTGVIVTKVVVQETKNCSAEASLILIEAKT